MDIAAWLGALGLDRYAQAFRDNDVDQEILTKLTAEDLVAIGVASVGHRRKLLEAIAALAAEPDVIRRATAAAPDQPAGITPGKSEAERRQLTVLFSDVVGSTEISACLDPEDMHEVIAAYHSCCTAVVHRFDGHVAKYMGDGVLAYFGYPRAHEDDAERAVRAGLELVRAVPGLRTPAPQPLAVRIGIDTGIVVVGDVIGSGAAREEAVVGDAPNRAARLQALAEPGAVLISDRTRRLLRSSFLCDDLGERVVKGFAAPMRIWGVAGLGTTEEGRLGTQVGGASTPLIGRDRELELLLRRWQESRRGAGRVVLISGEPGIGKSRLAKALRERLAGEPHSHVEYACSPYHVSTPYHPILEQLARAADFRRGDDAAARRRKLARSLTDDGAVDAAVIQYVLDLMAVEQVADAAVGRLEPHQYKEKVFEALLTQLERRTRAGPVLVVVDDAQWIDPTSHQFLELMVQRITRLPVLLLIACRPDWQPRWGEQSHLSTISLTRLDPRHTLGMLGAIVQASTLSKAVVDQIVARTDGVPLFVEELTKAILEAPAQERSRDGSPGRPVEIPMTLHDSLLARLDGLGPIKPLAQIAACIGRDFSYELLAAIAELSDHELRGALDRLTGSGLVLARPEAIAETYGFKHALVQEAAYHSLLRSRRREIHARIGAALAPMVGEREPEVVARHYQDAGMPEEAVDFWYRAGAWQIDRGAYEEAIQNLEQALRLLEGLGGEDRLARQELRVLAALGSALIAVRPQAAAEIKAAYERAYRLSEQVGPAPEFGPVLFGLAVFYFFRGELGRTEQLCERSLRLADEIGDDSLRIGARLMLGQCCFWRARHAEGVRQASLIDAMGEAVAAQPHQMARYAQDPRVTSRIGSAWSLCIMGAPEQAVAQARQAFDHARRLNHPYNLALAHQILAWLRQIRREYGPVCEAASDMLAIARQQGFVMLVELGDILLAWAEAHLGATEGRTERVGRVVDSWAGTGAHLAVRFGTTLLAETALREGAFDAGLAAIERAMRPSSSEDVCYDGELWRIKAELLAAKGERGVAVRSAFESALGVAREQGARWFELRAATGLARHAIAAAEPEGGADVAQLEAIHQQFSEAADLIDLREAVSVLQQAQRRGVRYRESA